MSYHASNGLGLTRHAPRYVNMSRPIQNLRTYADVWKNPNPSGEVATGRFHDIGIPLALQRQLQAELDARGKGMGELPYLDCAAILIEGGTGTACVDENLRRQQANMAEHDSGQRAIFLANCKRDYALNHGGSEAGNPCDSYSFGSTSEYAQPTAPPPAPVPVVTQSASEPTVQPASPSNTPTPPPPVPAATNSGGGYVAHPAIEEVLTADTHGIPMWMLLAAGAGALFLFGGKH